MSCFFVDLLLGDLGPDSDQILLDDASLTELILGEAGATDGSGVPGFDLLSSVEGTDEGEALQRPDVELQSADTPQQQFDTYQQVPHHFCAFLMSNWYGFL